jgi:hypothetical protein
MLHWTANENFEEERIMGKVVRMYAIWMLALASGVYGTALVYRGIFQGETNNLIFGIPILLLGIWVTGNMWASARQIYRKQKAAEKAV